MFLFGIYFIKKNSLDFLYVSTLHSTLLGLPLLKFHRFGKCRGRTQVCCDYGIDSQVSSL
jgi:hypothetical protein